MPDFIKISAPPKTAADLLEEISLKLGWFSSTAEAQESAESWADNFLRAVRDELGELNRLGRFASYAINSSSDYMLQGAAYIERRDGPDVREAKERRARTYDYVDALEHLNPDEFEALCTGVLTLFGVEEPTLTTSSIDEGIDFFGRLRLEGKLLSETIFPNVERQLLVWMLGQAKHYKKTRISTIQVRELVGAVELAKSHAFGIDQKQYSQLRLRTCDPIFYLFFTTGVFSSISWNLIEKSGVIGMDGEMLAAVLADEEVGLQGEDFDLATFKGWVKSFGR